MNNRLANERGPPRSGNRAAPSLDANNAGYGVVSPPNLKIAFDDGDGTARADADANAAQRAPGAVVKTKAAPKRRINNDIRGGGFFSSLLNFALKVGFFYLAIGAFYSCSSSPLKFDFDPKDSRGHCRTLAHAKAQIQPIVTPHLHAAKAKVQPYTQPYVDAAAPYATAAWKTARPYYKYTNKQARLYYRRNLEPFRKHYTKRGKAYIDPHLKTLNAHYTKQVEPHLRTTQRALKPYQDIYRRDVAPYLQHAYTRSLVYGSASYSFYVARVHPRVLQSLDAIHHFYVNHVDPAMRRAYALYIRPQVNKALAKVFGHRAHAVGSDAIREAKQDASQARKERKELEKEKVAEAKASASRAVEDPTLIDRLNKAKDHVVGGPLAAEDPVASAASDAELAVETTGTKDELEAWERGLSKLLDEEYNLVMNRIADIRARFSDTLPEQFGVITDDVETDVEGVFARLAKSFDKLRVSSASSSTSDQLQEGNTVVEKQNARLERSRSRASQSIAALYEDLQSEEATAQRASVAEVDRYIGEATRAYNKLMSSVKFPQTKAEWEGWDSGLRVRSELFAEELDGVRTGSRRASRGVTAIDTSALGDIQRQISKLQKQTETLYDAALADLTAFAAKELASLGASGASALASEKLSGASAALGSHASVASSVASSVIREGAKTAGISVQPETPGEYVASAVDAARTGADAAASSASSVAREAAKSVGIPVQPETPGEYVEAAVDAIKDQAAGVAGIGAAMGSHASAASSAVSSQASAASSAASSVAREGVKSAGISVQPETPGEYIESAVDAIKSQAGGVGAAVGSQASAAASAASSVARQGAKSAGIPVQPETPGEYIESAVDAIKSQAGDVGSAVNSQASVASSAAVSQASVASSAASSVAREGAKSAGIPVQPETPGEYVEAAVDAAKDYASQGSSSLSSALSGASAPSLPGASSSASSLLSSASSLARQGAKSAGVPLEPETPQEYAAEVLSAASAGLSSQSAAAAGAASSLASSAKSLAGVHASPDTPLETLASAAGLAGDVLAEGAHHATRSAASALGARPTPESASEYVEAVQQGVKDAGDKAGSVLSEARASASAFAYGGRDEL